MLDELLLVSLEEFLEDSVDLLKITTCASSFIAPEKKRKRVSSTSIPEPPFHH